jgi:DNA (cytosine-5)-methyltransferase 1
MALRFPDAENLGDITQIDWSSFNERPDIICGGFPCQDISLAGKGAGIDGDRSGLWRCYADAIRVLRPRGVLVENVAALLSRGIDRVLGDLAACGYDAEWDCIPAASVGAPHRRDRIFIVAYADEQRTQISARWKHPTVQQFGRDGAERSDKCGHWWSVEPSVGRVADGVPRRVDRLRCLGNAVVPQVAASVGRVLLERIER